MEIMTLQCCLIIIQFTVNYMTRLYSKGFKSALILHVCHKCVFHSWLDWTCRHQRRVVDVVIILISCKKPRRDMLWKWQCVVSFKSVSLILATPSFRFKLWCRGYLMLYFDFKYFLSFFHFTSQSCPNF